MHWWRWVLLGWCVATFLICDPQAGVTQYIISYDGCETFQPGVIAAQPDGSIKVDIDPLPPGSYVFCVEAQNASGTSGPSNTVVSTKHNAPTGAHIGN